MHSYIATTQFFSSNWFTVKFFSKTLIWRKICEKIVAAVKLCIAQCGNYGNLLSLFYGKNFVKVTFLLRNHVLDRWFDEFFFNETRVNFCNFYNYNITVWKLCLTLFWQKFRESNVFTKQITKKLIWRNIFSVRLNFSFFHNVNMQCNVEKWKILPHQKKYFVKLTF